MRNRFGTLLTIALVITGSSAEAQSIASGDRVRVLVEPRGVSVTQGEATAEDHVRLEGTLTEFRPDTVCMLLDGSEPDPQTVALPVSDISRLELYTGTGSKLWLGAAIGFAVGFAPMYSACATGGCGDMEDYGACCLAYGSLAGLGGALVGALFGSAFKTERWVEMPVESVRLSFTGSQIAVRVVF